MRQLQHLPVGKFRMAKHSRLPHQRHVHLAPRGRVKGFARGQRSVKLPGPFALEVKGIDQHEPG